MAKINRRQFLQRAGVSAAVLAVGVYGRSNASAATRVDDVASEGVSATVSDKGKQYEALLADSGAALVNPMMGWTMYFYSNELENYGSKLAPSDTVCRGRLSNPRRVNLCGNCLILPPSVG